MKRQMFVLLFPCVMALVMLSGWLNLSRLDAAAPSAPSATFNVNSTIDATDANPGDGVCETAPGNGVCTLRAAIQESNALTGADIIFVPDGNYVLTIPGVHEHAAATGDLDILDSTTIVGDGYPSTHLDANQIERGFDIRCANCTVSIAGFTIHNGVTTAFDTDGGGIRVWSYGSSITLTNLLIFDNQDHGLFVASTATKLTLSNSDIISNSRRGIYNRGIMFITTSVISGNHLIDPNNAGGAGILNFGTLTVTNSIIENNVNEEGSGGGLISYHLTKTTLEGVTVRNNQTNSSNYSGGGFHNGGQLTIINSVFENNIANGPGGGLSLASTGSVIISHTSFISNSASYGGAIYNDSVTNIYRSTISQNHTVNSGGGIFNEGDIVIDSSTIHNNAAIGLVNGYQGSVAIANSTISHNSGYFPIEGGGIAQRGTFPIVITNTTVYSNVQFTGTFPPTPLGISGGFAGFGGVSIKNSIVADGCRQTQYIVSQGFNLDIGSSCSFNNTGDITNTNPLLGPLQYNGGSTLTHALNPASPAIDAANNNECPATDQRGILRPLDGDGDGNPVCDMGAYEFTPNMPIISIGDASVIEGDIDTVVTPAVFTITLSVASTQTVTVTYTTVDGTAQAGSDYYFATSAIQFAPGQVTHTVSIYVSGDTVVEPDETFSVVLSNPINALIGDGTGVGTIINDDFIVPDITISDYAVSEGNSGTTMATFTVTLATVSNQTVTMTYTTADGTAQAGTDYAAASGQIVFTPGQSSYVIIVLINGDTVVEADETFTVELLNVINGTLVDGLAVGTILNDDVEPTAPPTVYLPLVVKP